MTGRVAPSAIVRDLLSLPVKMGGMNIQAPSDYSEHYKWSKMTTEPLYHSPPLVAENIQNRILNDIKSAKDKMKSKLKKLQSKLSEEEVYALNLASEKGSTSSLNALPLEKYGFHLTKGEFRDGLCFRYSWEPKNTPSVCPCSKIWETDLKGPTLT